MFLFLWGSLFFITASCNPAIDDSKHESENISEEECKEYYDIHKFLLSDYNSRHTEMLAADVSQLGSLAVNIRIMVKLTARQIYNTSVYWAKYAVRMIAEYMQHQSFITENLNSNKFRIGMTGSHILYLYQLCHIVI